MIKVYVGELYDGPAVYEVKGMRGGREWLAGEIEKALAYRAEDMTLSVRWDAVDIPESLRRRLVIVQNAPAG